MVLESLINPFKAKNKPLMVFVLGLFYASIALFLSFWVFREYSSLIMVFLTTLASVPLLYFTMRQEEEIGLKGKSNLKILKEHSRVFVFLLLLYVLRIIFANYCGPKESIRTVVNF